MSSFSEIHESIADMAFFNRMGFGEDSLTALAIPVYMNYGVPFLDVCCLYIKDIIFTPFVSLDFCSKLKSAITMGLNVVNKEIEGQLVASLIKKCFSFTNTSSFYKEASNYIAKYNSVDDCLIYVKGNQGELLLAREEDLNEPTTYKNKPHKIGQLSCYVPLAYANDDEFLDFLSDLIVFENNPKANAALFQSNTISSKVKNAVCVAIQNGTQKNDTSGVIVLINRNHKTRSDGIKDFDVMSVDNVTVTYLSALYLHQLGLWNKAVSRKNYLLKKLRHEIPHCTRVIGDKVCEVERLALSALDKEDFSNCTNAIKLNTNRISMLSSFFAAVDYEDEKFSLNKNTQNLLVILNDNLPLFKEEASKKGVEVSIVPHVPKLDIQISDFYPLAIINLINNAIRYCSRGTIVKIHIFSDRIEVSDIGIPILDGEKDLIFNDGFRGSNAKKIDVEGIGFGLHLSKRVIEAHGDSIEASSEPISDENIYLEHVIYSYLRSLDAASRNLFIYETVEPYETDLVNKLYEKISQNTPLSHMDYCNSTFSQIKKWLNDERRTGGPAFIEMEDVWFQEPVAKVTFSVLFK